MGIKQTDILSFIEPDSMGFYYDTARSFLKRHADPNALLCQLKDLLVKGQLDTCRDMIQLIIREGHILADGSELYLLRAEIAFLQAESHGVFLAWLQQARICNPLDQNLLAWDKFVFAQTALAEGDYVNGQLALEDLLENQSMGHIAQFHLAQHLFWKNIDCQRALLLLEDVVDRVPEFIKAWSCLGFAYNKFGMKAKAQQAFGHCIELDSNPERLKMYKQQIAS